MRNYSFNSPVLIFGNIINFFTKGSSLELFFVLAPIVFTIQFSLLKIILTNGFTADDWLLLFDYKTIGSSGDFLERLFAIFHTKGIYTSYQVLYIGILESLFKGNYQAYQVTNIIFKVLATLSLYPLISVVFKSKLLAFLTTILYAISYSSTGALQFVVKGSDYLAILFMNLCLAMYYFSLKKKRKNLLFITAILLFLTFIFSPIRMYPFLLFIILLEIFIWIKSKGLMGPIFALLRLVLLFSPFLILILFLPQSTGGYLNAPKTIYQFLSYGNYQLLLIPFAGSGYTFLTNDYWPIFGQISFNNFKEYLLFLLKGPIIIYSILTILIGFLISKKNFLFILGVILTNIIFEIICYFLITNLKGVVGPNVKSFNLTSTYAVFFGFFSLSVSLSSLIMWLRHKSSTLHLSLFAGPFFSSIFLWGTWFIIGDSLTFKEGIHWYLIIPPIGTSLFLASLMVIMYDKVKTITQRDLRYILTVSIFFILLPIYIISSKEINTTFSYLHHIGYGASDQELIKAKLIRNLKNPIEVKSALFYLDSSEEQQNPLYYPVTLISGFNEKMHFRDWELISGCTGLIYDKITLEKSIVVKDGIRGFNVSSLCIHDYSAVGRQDIFYEPENFYALKLKNKEVINIKDSILKELGFNE